MIKLRDTLNEVKANLKSKSQQFNEKMENKIQNKYKNVTKIIKKDKNKAEMYICKRPVGSISGILYTILGFALKWSIRYSINHILNMDFFS